MTLNSSASGNGLVAYKRRPRRSFSSNTADSPLKSAFLRPNSQPFSKFNGQMAGPDGRSKRKHPEAEVGGENEEKRPKEVPSWKKMVELSEEEVIKNQYLIKIEIASLCQEILANPRRAFIPPPNDLHKVNVLLSFVNLPTIELKKLVLLSLVAVYKDILPGYRISSHTMNQVEQLIESSSKSTQGSGIQVKKGVKALWRFEKELLTSYETFLSILFECVSTSKTQKKKRTRKTGRQEAVAGKENSLSRANEMLKNIRLEISNGYKMELKSIAIRCMCTLLVAKPQFNFRELLIKHIIPSVSAKSERRTRKAKAETTSSFLERAMSDQCVACINTLLATDISYEMTLEIITVLSNLVKKYIQAGTVHYISQKLIICTLNCKLKVDLKDEKRYQEAKKEVKKRKWKLKNKKDLKNQAFANMIQTEAVENFHVQYARQAEGLRELFLTYLRLLKYELNHGDKQQGSRASLLPTVLKGISKFVLLVNLDLVQDLVYLLLDALNKTNEANKAAEAETSTLQMESSLRSIHCVCLTLQGPGKELKIDETGFITALFSILEQLNVLQLDSATTAVDDYVLPIVECVEVLFLKKLEQPRSRVVKMINKLGRFALCTKPHASLALISCIRFLMSKYSNIHKNLCELLFESEVEKRENGVTANYDSASPSQLGMMSHTKELSTTSSDSIWSLCNLFFHYHPSVSQLSRKAVSKQNLSLETFLAPSQNERPFAMFKRYDARNGGFYPPVQKKPQNNSAVIAPAEVLNKAQAGGIISAFSCLEASEESQPTKNSPDYEYFKERLRAATML